SSLISLTRACSGVSPSSILPPGNSHPSLNSPYPLCVAKILSSFLITAATTRTVFITFLHSVSSIFTYAFYINHSQYNHRYHFLPAHLTDSRSQRHCPLFFPYKSVSGFPLQRFLPENRTLLPHYHPYFFLQTGKYDYFYPLQIACKYEQHHWM